MMLNAEEMALHRVSGARCITVFDRMNDRFMLGKAMMVLRRPRGIDAKPSPNDGTPNGVQSVE